MVQEWYVARNNIYFKAHIALVESPTWIYILERIVGWGCDKCTHKWLWWVHAYIHTPIFNLWWKKTTETRIPFPYKFLLEKFPKSFDEGEYNQYIDDPEEDEEDKIRYRQYQNEDKILYDEFMKIYTKIEERDKINFSQI